MFPIKRKDEYPEFDNITNFDTEELDTILSIINSFTSKVASDAVQ